MVKEPSFINCSISWIKNLLFIGLVLTVVMIISWFIHKAFIKAVFKYDVYVKKKQFGEPYEGYNEDYMANAYNRKPVYEFKRSFWVSRPGHFSNKTNFFTQCLNCYNTTNLQTRRWCKESTTKWCPISSDTPNIFN